MNIRLDKHEYGNLSFSATSNWVAYKEDQGIISFFKKTKEDSLYKPNFTILIFNDAKIKSNQSLDQIVSENMAQLSEVYTKVHVLSYDTISNELYKGRKVAFVALNSEQGHIGSLLYVLKNQDALLIASFQGPNEDGVFIELVPELENIASSIKF